MIILSGCTSSVTLPDISSVPGVCHLDDTCTGVNCCLSPSLLSHSLNVRVSLDPCAYLMTVYLEKLQINVDLYNYTQGRAAWSTGVGLFDKKENFLFMLKVFIWNILNCRHKFEIFLEWHAWHRVSNFLFHELYILRT